MIPNLNQSSNVVKKFNNSYLFHNVCFWKCPQVYYANKATYKNILKTTQVFMIW